MSDLYRLNGGAPTPLPDRAYGANGDAYTAPFSADDLASLGFVLAPARPADTATKTSAWDAAAEKWIMVDKPPAPEPEPQTVDPYAHYVPVPLLRQRLEKLGLFDDFSAYLAQFPTLMFKVLSLERGVDPEYPDLLTAFDAMSVPQATRDYLMAHPSLGVQDG